MVPPSSIGFPAAASSPVAVSALNGEELVSLLLRSFELTETSVSKLHREEVDPQALFLLSEVRQRPRAFVRACALTISERVMSVGTCGIHAKVHSI